MIVDQDVQMSEPVERPTTPPAAPNEGTSSSNHLLVDTPSLMSMSSAEVLADVVRRQTAVEADPIALARQRQLLAEELAAWQQMGANLGPYLDTVSRQANSSQVNSPPSTTLTPVTVDPAVNKGNFSGQSVVDAGQTDEPLFSPLDCQAEEPLGDDAQRNNSILVPAPKQQSVEEVADATGAESSITL